MDSLAPFFYEGVEKFYLCNSASIEMVLAKRNMESKAHNVAKQMDKFIISKENVKGSTKIELGLEQEEPFIMFKFSFN